ncbi:porin [Rhodoferax sp.]|jgi:predicted porin|uniref:porin n=1 Tax=Rhodoferax sp. TaxID=50421 RepID=UPI00272F43E3|nr:porin [Rhodoferax sp.]MDP2443004.1 porin [Rhodoferax sp.]MDP3190698.1 porin [Rhodoferax sp.]MDP3335619.1 porin [Rhodoferax sp.]MDP3865582.1 porin [Rhodoferax sp.]MDZ4206529.1 porin [Rhodoferax sp.]
MKKSLIALAVLAASGAAMAQSSVTVYGLADIWFGSVKTEDGVAGTSLRQTKLDSGGVNGSRWGLKGSEDLGGGLKANFKLEQGFKLDDGTATAGQAFSREAYVGFSGGFGEVKLGKVWTAYDDVSGASNAVFDSALAPMNNVFVSTGYQGNPGNTIYYATPTMGGLSGALSYSLGENKTAALSASSVTSLNLTYGAGPVAVQFGYQDEDTQGTSNDTKFTRLGASYDFGVATAKVSYGKVTDIGNAAGFDATEYQIGVDVPVSAALTVSASYASSKDDSPAAVFEEKRSGYGLAAAYTLSKRTFLYGGYTSNKFTNNGAADDKLSILAVGVQHRF